MNDILKALIKDEIEAVNGYDKALSTITDKVAIAKLTEIRDEEKKHIEELKSLLFDDDEEN